MVPAPAEVSSWVTKTLLPVFIAPPPLFEPPTLTPRLVHQPFSPLRVSYVCVARLYRPAPLGEGFTLRRSPKEESFDFNLWKRNRLTVHPHHL